MATLQPPVVHGGIAYDEAMRYNSHTIRKIDLQLPDTGRQFRNRGRHQTMSTTGAAAERIPGA